MYTVITLGGSLIVKDEVRTDFLKKFRPFILRFLKKGRKFVIVAGGGKICRKYQQAAAQISRIPSDDMDWLGIHVTRLNAQLLRTVFLKEAYPEIIESLLKPIRGKPKLIFAAGVRAGNSTDYVAVMLARRFKANRVIVAGTYDAVYDKDFEKYPNAKRLLKLSWKTYRSLIEKKWRPGYRAPMDPVAALAAQKFGIRADIIKAENLKNFSHCIEEKSFRGSVIY
ncbi:MAG: UMP kinase [bacterium]|nr:UMP kinase [bacterium]